MSKRKILIVDDEQGFSELVKINLESTGLFNVVTEADPRNAKHVALQFQPDLILLDVIMAHMEGPDVATDFKNDPVLKYIPVIFLTATVTQQEVDNESGVIGGHPFVAKPSSLDTLLGAIEKNMMAI